MLICSYLSEDSSFVLSFMNGASTKGRGCSLTCSSGALYIKEDNKGSGSVFEENGNEDPPRRACRLPSRSSFLNIENVELVPLRNFLLR